MTERVNFGRLPQIMDLPNLIEVQIKSEKNTEMLGFLLTYIVPFSITFENGLYDLFAFCLLFILLLHVYIKTSLFCINPLLNYSFGYNIYEIEMHDMNGFLLTTRKHRNVNKLIKIYKITDDLWKEQLREMDELKQSVQNASYEQKDPLLIYKFESFELFKKMIQKINKDVGSYLIKGDVYMKDTATLQEVKMPRGLDRSQMKEERGDMLSQAHSDTQEKQKPQPVKVEKRVGRNDPCPCGSGKKFKHCHGRN